LPQVDELVNHRFQPFFALDPVVFNGVWQAPEDVELVVEPTGNAR
jgi:hypothetical protein